MNEGQPPSTNPEPAAGAVGSETVPSLIAEVPGFERPVAEVAKDALNNDPAVPGVPGSRENPVIADNGAFRGNPAHVPGHPANKFSGMNIESLRAPEPAAPQPLAPGGIAEVPPNIK